MDVQWEFAVTNLANIWLNYGCGSFRGSASTRLFNLVASTEDLPRQSATPSSVCLKWEWRST